MKKFMDVEHLHVVLAQLESPPSRFHVEDDRGEFHEHGPGGLQERVQGRVGGADVQVPPVDADEVGAFARSGEDVLHVVDEPFMAGSDRKKRALSARPRLVWTAEEARGATMEPSFSSPAP